MRKKYNSKDEDKERKDKAKKEYEWEINNLKKYVKEHPQLAKVKKEGKEVIERNGKGSFKNLYWWVINLKDEVDIYGVKYNKIYLMPYTFGLTEEDLNPNKKTKVIELKSYSSSKGIIYSETEKYKKYDRYKEIQNNKLNLNFDTTTGNIHPEEWVTNIKADGKLKQLILVRDVPGGHYGVLFGTNILNKEKEKEFIILQSDSDKYYIPKKCIKLIKEDQKVEEALKDFFR